MAIENSDVVEAPVEAVESAGPAYDEATLTALTRSELQTMSKETGACKANLSNVKMISALCEFYQTSSVEAPAIIEEQAPAVVAVEEQTIFEAVAAVVAEAPTVEIPMEMDMEADVETLPVVESVPAPALSNLPPVDDFGLDALVNKFSDVLSVTTTIVPQTGKVVKRVKCDLTEHEMPLDFNMVVEHVGGQTFTRRYKQYQDDWEDQQQQYAATYTDENENSAPSENTAPEEFTGKLKGVASPKGKKKVFKSPSKTPTRVYEKYNAHWTIDEYDQNQTTAN